MSTTPELTPNQKKLAKALTKAPQTAGAIARKVDSTPQGIGRNLSWLRTFGLAAQDQDGLWVKV